MVKIVNDPSDYDALELIEFVLEDSAGAGSSVEHEILPDQAAGIGQALREEFRLRDEQQPRGFRSVRAENCGLRFL